MATINLGSIKFNWQGAYNGATAYAVDDVVSYNGSSYICKLASTGNLPTNTTYFDQMSSAGTNGTDGTDLTTTLTTQGDIVYRDASGLARLGAGNVGQVLQSGGTGANPSWGSVSSDYVRIANLNLTSGTKASFDNVFSTSDGYQSYKCIMHRYKPTSPEWLKFTWRSGGSDLTNNYKWRVDAFRRKNDNTMAHENYGSSGDSFIPIPFWSQRTGGFMHSEIDLGDPVTTSDAHAIRGDTSVSETGSGLIYHLASGLRDNTSSSYDGFSLQIANTSYSFTNMDISVYGIK